MIDTIKRTGTMAVIALLALAAACTPGEETGQSKQATAEANTSSSDAGTQMTPAAVLIIHEVGDYDAWKAVFDEHQQARKDASCLGHYVKRGVDDRNRVYVYCLATDADRLRGFLDSDDLARAMKTAGVEENPTIIMMKPMSRNLVPERKLPGIIVMHAVEDYDSWRGVYDELDDFRRLSGIIGHAVTQEFGNPKRVIVYHQAEDVGSLRAFVDSADLRDAMDRAGVVGDPDIHFIQVVGFDRY